MTQEISNTLPQHHTMFGAPLCTNLDDLSADIAFLGVPWEQGQIGWEFTGQSRLPVPFVGVQGLLPTAVLGVLLWKRLVDGGIWMLVSGD